jgi:hypothetical protein
MKQKTNPSVVRQYFKQFCSNAKHVRHTMQDDSSNIRKMLTQDAFAMLFPTPVPALSPLARLIFDIAVASKVAYQALSALT